MNEKRIIWAVVTGTGLLVGWRTVRTGNDPVPQLAGIGATGVILLLTAEVAPKLASAIAVLVGISFTFGWVPTQQVYPVDTGGGGGATVDRPI